jgi:hypothetical protein
MRLAPVRPLVHYTTERVDRLARRGRAEIAATRNGSVRVASASASAIRLEESEALPSVFDGVAAPIVGSILDAALPIALDKLRGDSEPLMGVIDNLLEPLLPDVLDRLAERPDLIVNLVQPVLGPVIEAALPEVFARIGEHPDELVEAMAPIVDELLDQMLPVVLARLADQSTSIRALITEQSGSLATDLANEMRSRVVSGDDLIERVLVRTHVRRPAAAAPPAAVAAALPPAASNGGRT